MTLPFGPRPLAAFAVVAALGILAIDLQSPLGIADGMLYVGVVLVGLWLPGRYTPHALAALSSVLILAGYVFTGVNGDPMVSMVNRGLSLFVVWAAALLVALRQGSAARVQEEQAVLRAVMDTSADGVITIDEAGLVRSFSQAAETLFGYRESEIVGRNVNLLMPEPDRSAHDGYLRRYLETGQAQIIGRGRIVEAQRRDGSRFPAHLMVGEIRRGGRRLFTGFVHDVTDRRKAEFEAAAQKRFADTILDTTEAMVVVADPDGRILRCNRTWERLTGYPAEEVVGRSWWTFVPEELRATIEANFKSLVARGGQLRLERDWTTRSGERRRAIWMSTLVAESEGDRQYVVVTGIDVTEERQAEARAKQLQNELYRIGRLSELGEMASAIAHELNQPLTAITNYARASRMLIAEGGGSSPRALDFMDKAVGQADRAGQIIRRLRQLIGHGESELVPCDISRAVRDACTLAAVGTADRDIEMRLDLAEDLPAVLADSTQIQQVAFNLVRNSIDALDGCPVRLIRVSTRPAEDGGVEVTVADSGPGLAPEVRARLFMPFVTTKPNGMGIGLSICRSIIDAHRGRLWAEPDPVGGTIFRFSLPERADEADQRGDGQGRDGEGRDGRSQHG